MVASLLLLLTTSPARAQTPRIPFGGVYGATAGAGSTLAWDRPSGGENPARLGSPGWTFSAAGYAPFGLENLQVVEAGIVRDRPRVGASMVYRGLFARDDEANASRPFTELQGQLALRLGEAGTAGVQVSRRAQGNLTGQDNETGYSFGMLWSPAWWTTLGGYAGVEHVTWGSSVHAGGGIDAGRKSFGIPWRIGIDGLYAWSGQINGKRDKFEIRYAGGIRLHETLSLYAGWTPHYGTMALGARFGFSDLEIFSAMRRHTLLGGSSVQGIRWKRAEAR